MADKKDIREKIREIYAVLPKLDDQRCGYKTCGEFARAVAEGRESCHGCVSGGPEVAARVCEIMGARVPERAIPQFNPSLGFYRLGLSGGRGTTRVSGGARGISRRGGMGGGFARGRHGR
jgi:hypothetical protein